jgi:hypothetical protein
MNHLIEKIIEISRDNGAAQKIEQLLETQLSHEPTNAELWLRLAILESNPPIVDCYKALDCLNKVLEIDSNNTSALLIFAYINYYQIAGVNKALFDKLISFHASSNELNSMLRYATSWYYAQTEKNILLEEKLLRESIELYSLNVWNYVDLARILFTQEKKEEAKTLVKKALGNVKKIYPPGEEREKYDKTDVNEFLNERIRGIYLSNQNYEMIAELLEKPE